MYETSSPAIAETAIHSMTKRSKLMVRPMKIPGWIELVEASRDVDEMTYQVRGTGTSQTEEDRPA
jgi:hypothetical protein